MVKDRWLTVSRSRLLDEDAPTTVANPGGEDDEYEGGACLLAAVSWGVLGLDVGWVPLGPALREFRPRGREDRVYKQRVSLYG